MQLVLLCREQDFKYFGHNQVFNTLVQDIKELEMNGITLEDGEVLKGTLCAIAGNNLGSHSIGRFLENFSRSQYFCRYCEIDRDTFQSTVLSYGPKRTIQMYKDRIQDLEMNSLDSSGGVKFDSIFNQLNYNHVSQPGLPPCLGHDLFEGIVSGDLALYIKCLVTEHKCFTYLELNHRIDQFHYLGSDADNKPCEVNTDGEKLGGHAVQNWCLLRMLPMLVGDHIENALENKVWQQVLQLQKIVELICALRITSDRVFYLKDLIDEYHTFILELSYSLTTRLNQSIIIYCFTLNSPYSLGQSFIYGHCSLKVSTPISSSVPENYTTSFVCNVS